MKTRTLLIAIAALALLLAGCAYDVDTYNVDALTAEHQEAFQIAADWWNAEAGSSLGVGSHGDSRANYADLQGPPGRYVPANFQHGATVLIDSHYREYSRSWPCTIFRHELGHHLGYPHNSDPDSPMYVDALYFWGCE